MVKSNIASLDDEAAEIEGILYQLAGLLDGHTLLLAELSQQLRILLLLGVIKRIDDGCLMDVSKTPFFGTGINLLWISDKDKICHTICQDLVGSFECTLLSTFGQHDALLVCLGACNELFDEFHILLYFNIYYQAKDFLAVFDKPS